jgi:RNA polymerase sigma-70 factor (ECF subfamily)
MSQASLMERARAGDGCALGELLEQFRPRLRALAQGRLNPRWQARVDESDLAQLTVLTAMHAFPAFRGTSEKELAVWLEAILHQHLAAMTRTHVRTEKRSALREVSADPPADSDGDWQLAAEDPTPSGVVMQGEMREEIERALQSLSWEQREAVRLRFLHDWSVNQIAQFLDKTERSVAGLIYRGLDRLKDVLRDRGTVD